MAFGQVPTVARQLGRSRVVGLGDGCQEAWGDAGGQGFSCAQQFGEQVAETDVVESDGRGCHIGKRAVVVVKRCGEVIGVLVG